jgi:hypothetical protein
MRALVFSLPLAAFAWLLPADVRADDAPARRFEVEDRGPNRMILASGIATLGFSYGVSGYVGATSPRESERFLLVPVLGPWMALAEREACGSPPAVPCETESTYQALLVASGGLQLLGLAEVAYAFVKRERREVERPLVTALAFRGGAGIGAIAKF